jgi:tRNA ligase
LRLCSERVVGRGENHQTLRADLSERAEHESVVAKFIRNFTVPVEGTFSRMESMRVESDPQESVSRAVEYLVAVPGLKLDRPTPEAIREAVSAALGYTISTPPRDVAKTAKPPRYYGIAPEIDLEALVRDALAAHPSASASEFFNSLVEKKRITPRPHITLVHEKTVEEEAASGSAGSAAALWETCKSMQSAPRLPLFEFDMGLLIWDGRAMTLSVENLRTAAGYEAPELKINVDLRRSLHVTVGTAAEDIPAYESRALVWTVRGAIERGEKSAEGVQWIEVGGLNGQGRIRGMS